MITIGETISSLGINMIKLEEEKQYVVFQQLRLLFLFDLNKYGQKKYQEYRNYILSYFDEYLIDLNVEHEIYEKIFISLAKIVELNKKIDINELLEKIDDILLYFTDVKDEREMTFAFFLNYVDSLIKSECLPDNKCAWLNYTCDYDFDEIDEMREELKKIIGM